MNTQLGLLFPPKIDYRNLQLRNYLRPVVPPLEYYWEKKHQVPQYGIKMLDELYGAVNTKNPRVTAYLKL